MNSFQIGMNSFRLIFLYSATASCARQKRQWHCVFALLRVSAANSQEISIYFNKYLFGQNKYFLAYFWEENKYILAWVSLIEKVEKKSWKKLPPKIEVINSFPFSLQLTVVQFYTEQIISSKKMGKKSLKFQET